MNLFLNTLLMTWTSWITFCFPGVMTFLNILRNSPEIIILTNPIWTIALFPKFHFLSMVILFCSSYSLFEWILVFATGHDRYPYRGYITIYKIVLIDWDNCSKLLSIFYQELHHNFPLLYWEILKFVTFLVISKNELSLPKKLPNAITTFRLLFWWYS